MSYRYIGNKTRLTNEILGVLARYVKPGARVADPMCGTAAMAAALRCRGYCVVASDLLTFAAQHAHVRLCLEEAPSFAVLDHAVLDQTYESVQAHLNSLPPERGLFFREYGPDGAPTAGVPARKYFSADNAGRIDAIRRMIGVWRPRLSESQHALLRHDLVLAANRVANIAGTYGHFRSTLSSGSLRRLKLIPTKFLRGNSRGHTVLQGPVEKIASEITADVCYLDPPYMKRQYAANYHILETLARGDEPEALGVSGLRDWWDQYSDFCSKRNIADAFAATFEKMDCPLFLVSYSEDGLITTDQMTAIFREFGHVTRYDFRHQRFKSNSGGVGGSVTEHLYVVDKR